MATINPQVPLVTQVELTLTTLTAGSTISIAPSTAQGSLDTQRMVVFFQSTSSTLSSIEPLVGSTYSSIGQSNFSAIAIPTSEGIICFGGVGFETSRMLKTDGAIDFYNTGNDVYVWAVQVP